MLPCPLRGLNALLAVNVHFPLLVVAEGCGLASVIPDSKSMSPVVTSPPPDPPPVPTVGPLISRRSNKAPPGVAEEVGGWVIEGRGTDDSLSLRRSRSCG